MKLDYYRVSEKSVLKRGTPFRCTTLAIGYLDR